MDIESEKKQNNKDKRVKRLATLRFGNWNRDFNLDKRRKGGKRTGEGCFANKKRDKYHL
jgi:hypothetical protein